MEDLSVDPQTILRTIVVVTGGYLALKSVIACFKFMKWRQIYNEMPGEKSFNLVFGNLHMFPGPNEAGIAYDMHMIRSQAPKLLRVWAGPFLPVILLHHPDVVKPILKSSEPKPRGGLIAGPYDMGVPWLGEGLLIANGAKWARNRKLLTPAFHFDILKPYIAVNNQASDVLVEKIAKNCESGKPFEVFDYMSLCALDIILRCAFSYTTDCQTSGEGHPYVRAVNDLAMLWSDRSLNPLMQVDAIYFLTPKGRKFKKMCKFVHDVAEEIIEKRKKALKEQDVVTEGSGKKRILDFLDILLTAKDDSGKGLTFLEIRNEVDTFLFEGHDTTTSGMSWMLYHMAKHPEYQSRVQEEIDDVLRGRETPHIQWEDLPKLEYLSLCLKESLRNRPPVPFIERMLTQDTVLAGYTVPKGTFLGIQINNLCHNPFVWDRPDDYYPERFLNEDKDKIDTFSFVPFSAGPRNCIGQNFAMHEMKVVIARILYRFTLRLDPDHEVKRRPVVTMRTETGMLMYATPRTPS